MRTWTLLGLLAIAAGCAGGAPDEPSADHPATPAATPSSAQAPTPTMTPGATPLPKSSIELPSGIVFRDPATSRLRAVEGDAPSIELMPGGFDIRGNVLAQGTNEHAIAIYHGVSIPRLVGTGLNHVGRLSLAPDASAAVVQATAAPRGEPPTQFDVYVIDLREGNATKLSNASFNDESPEWSPDGMLIAWSSFSPEEGIDLHLARPDGSEHRVIDDAGAIHIAFSPDGARILDAGRLRILELASGEVVADLREGAIAGMRAAGYELDTRFSGQAGRGTFPLDGAFSPDGQTLVFDGAVVKEGAYGVAIMTMRVDGTGFEVVAGPFTVDPARTNNLNYSELNPMWR